MNRMKKRAVALTCANVLSAAIATEKPLTVHVVTHSHLDPGWLLDVDSLYYTVEHIFDSVSESLLKDHERKYTVGDIYYFRRWYLSLNEDKKAGVKRLVDDGQLEIVHGGAVSTDEANVSYQDIIDNMIATRHWLKSEFGVVPNIGWQLDPFGHSSANARIFADLGMDALVFARMDTEQ